MWAEVARITPLLVHQGPGYHPAKPAVTGSVVILRMAEPLMSHDHAWLGLAQHASSARYSVEAVDYDLGACRENRTTLQLSWIFLLAVSLPEPYQSETFRPELSRQFI